MRKFFVIAIPIVTLALFVAIMLSSSFLKKPMGKNDNFPKAIHIMIDNVNEEQWDKASQDIDKLDQMWKKITKRVQFSSERDEINYVSTNLARLKGAVQSKDKSSALMELYDAFNHWKELGE